MRIYEYDEVDPLEVLHLNLLCLEYALTPERAAVLRRLDPRPFPCFGLYAKREGTVAGQVGVLRLPVVSTEGADEVGGVSAVATHPAFARQGIASLLLDEAHLRMHAAGLRYSTLITSRYRGAYALYRRHGYEELLSPASLLARRTMLPTGTGLRAERAGRPGLALADQVFEQIARNHLGFARRHTPFFAALDAHGELSARDLWLVWEGSEPAGYAAVSSSEAVLKLNNLLLYDRVDPAAAVAAVAGALPAPYVWVRVDQTGLATRFRQAGFRQVESDWGAFMVKPLAADATVEQFRRLYGMDTGRFLLSYLDVA